MRIAADRPAQNTDGQTLFNHTACLAVDSVVEAKAYNMCSARYSPLPGNITEIRLILTIHKTTDGLHPLEIGSFNVYRFDSIRFGCGD